MAAYLSAEEGVLCTMKDYLFEDDELPDDEGELTGDPETWLIHEATSRWEITTEVIHGIWGSGNSGGGE